MNNIVASKPSIFFCALNRIIIKFTLLKIMAVKRIQFFNTIMVVIIFTFLDIACGDKNENYTACMKLMKEYCKSENPNVVNCGSGAILQFKQEESVPDYIKKYFKETIYPHIKSQINIHPPTKFCQYSENYFGDIQNTNFYLDFINKNASKIPENKSLQDFCIANLVDFHGYSDKTILEKAFFEKNLKSYQSDEKCLAELYLHYISLNISYNAREGGVLQPSEYCEMCANNSEASNVK